MKFIALGGTDYIGASSYYLEIDDTKILLDFGANILPEYPIYPQYETLFSSKHNSEFFNSLSQLDALLISHGHYDHIGGLTKFTNLAPNVPIYATNTTKELAIHLFYDKIYMNSKLSGHKLLYKDIELDKAIERLHSVTYSKSFLINKIKVTFYEAGHIPGAAMIFLESKECSVLYAGDFLKEGTYLTSGYLLPKELKVDTLILCGTHAKHPFYKNTVTINLIVYKIRGKLTSFNKTVYCAVKQLTKGVEILQAILRYFKNIDVYLDETLWNLCQKLDKLDYQTLNGRCKKFSVNRYFTPKSGIYIGGNKYRSYFAESVEHDFSLHATFEDCAELIKTYKPLHAFLVHSPNDRNTFGNTALEEAFESVQVISPKIGNVYSQQ